MNTVRDMIAAGNCSIDWLLVDNMIDKHEFAKAVDYVRMLIAPRSNKIDAMEVVLRSIGQQIAKDDATKHAAENRIPNLSVGPVYCAGCGSKLICLDCDRPDWIVDVFKHLGSK